MPAYNGAKGAIIKWERIYTGNTIAIIWGNIETICILNVHDYPDLKNEKMKIDFAMKKKKLEKINMYGLLFSRLLYHGLY